MNLMKRNGKIICSNDENKAYKIRIKHITYPLLNQTRQLMELESENSLIYSPFFQNL